MLEAPSGAEKWHAPLTRETDARQRAIEASVRRAGRRPQAVEGGERAGTSGRDGVCSHPLVINADPEPPPAVLKRRAGLTMRGVSGVIVPNDADAHSPHRPDSSGRTP